MCQALRGHASPPGAQLPAEGQDGILTLMAMMTGPDHYAAAMEWLDEASAADERNEPDTAREYRKTALVHATLANAAATAMFGAGDRIGEGLAMRSEDAQEWRRVAGASSS
jgi:hypothetical protein